LLVITVAKNARQYVLTCRRVNAAACAPRMSHLPPDEVVNRS